MPPAKPSCHHTVMAVIYTGLQESRFASASDAEALAKDIGNLETRIWKYCRERYLGIFPMAGPAAPQFAKLGKFHIATETCHVVKGGILEPLLENGTTHVLIVGTAAAAAAIEVKKHGLHTCVFLPATRGLLESVEELKAADVVIADADPALNLFLDSILELRPHKPKCHCDAIMEEAGLSPAWCVYKRNNFLWGTTMRLSRALTAVTAAGFDGVWPPYMEKDPALRYKGRWRCSEIEKEELAAAIDQASAAGIHIGDAMSIYSYMPSFEKVNWCTFWSLKEKHDHMKEGHAQEVAELKAQLAAAEAKVKSAEPCSL